MSQVTQCYKARKHRFGAPIAASNTVLLAAVLLACAGLLTGCGSGRPSAPGDAPAPLRAGDLPGWRAVDAPPGIGELAPNLSGLTVTGRADAPAFVRAGNVVRATVLVFAKPKEAAEALKRGSGDDYQATLEEAFHGDTVGHGSGVGYRLRVPRPTGAGVDTVEVLLVRRGRRLTLVELESAAGFDPTLRARIIELVSR